MTAAHATDTTEVRLEVAAPAGETARLAATAVVRPGDRAPAEPPPGIALCWGCGRVEERLDPPDWMLVCPSHHPHESYVTGLCPDCLAGKSPRGKKKAAPGPR